MHPENRIQATPLLSLEAGNGRRSGYFTNCKSDPGIHRKKLALSVSWPQVSAAGQAPSGVGGRGTRKQVKELVNTGLYSTMRRGLQETGHSPFHKISSCSFIIIMEGLTVSVRVHNYVLRIV